MIVVSGCLVGENCKYNEENNKSQNVLNFLKDKEYARHQEYCDNSPR